MSCTNFHRDIHYNYNLIRTYLESSQESLQFAKIVNIERLTEVLLITEELYLLYSSANARYMRHYIGEDATMSIK